MLLVETSKKKKITKTKRNRVPKELIYEMRKGKHIYYRDYKKVINGEKTLEEIMGSSILQAKLIMMIIKFLLLKLSKEKYEIFTNELGYQWEPKTWRNLDIAIFDKKKLEKEGIHNKYAKTSPEIVIEIDTKADLSKYDGSLDIYMREKTQDLLDSGVKKVIWYTTKDKKVMFAQANKSWLIDSWDFNIELIEGIILNLGKLIEEEKLEL